jgi:predicted dehydrogenase
MTQLRTAIAGLGFMGSTHLDALRRLGVSVVGAVGINAEESERFQEKTNIAHIFKDYDDLVNDSAIDVVHICTPNYLHTQMIKKAMLAGKHVVCEKPLTRTSAESEELVRLAKEKQLVGAVNYNLRFYPLCQEARLRVQRGDIGDAWLIHGEYCQDWLFLDTDWNWRLESEQGGELRAVSDIGTHWLDLVMWITGQKISAVCADLKTMLPTRYKPKDEVETFTSKLTTSNNVEEMSVDTEDYGGIMLKFANGARGMLMVSQVSAGRKNRFFWEINGSKSSLSWNQEMPNKLWLGYREKPNEVMLKDPGLMGVESRRYASYPGGHAEGYPDTFVQMFKSVYQYIESGDLSARSPFATFEDGMHELELCEAILKSAKEQRWVEIH